MNKKGSNSIAILLIVVIVIVVAIIFIATRSSNSNTSNTDAGAGSGSSSGSSGSGGSGNSGACDADVFECPDGSFVSRDSNNNCEFRACPAGAVERTQIYDVVVTNNGFSPNKITIPAGSLVAFTNQRSVPVWVASNIHPTHTQYPGSSISKCGTNEQIFDACSEFNEGDIYSFVFNEAGTWGYHDHLHPSMKGTIIVQ